MEDIGGGATEGEEKEDEAGNGTLGSSLLDGDGGRLEGCEGRGVFLNLGLGSEELGGYLGEGVVLDLHVVLEFDLTLTDRLQDDVVVGIDKLSIEATSLVVTGLGLGIEFLVVLQIHTGLTGTIVGDEVLQAGLDRISHRGADDGILIFDVNRNHHRLFINVADDVFINSLHNLGLFFT